MAVYCLHKNCQKIEPRCEEGGAPVQPLQPRPAIPDPQDNDGGLGAVHQVI